MNSNAHAAPRRIYLDHQATTPVAPEVLAAMLPHFSDAFGNPSSRQHGFGLDAAASVEHARRRILALLGSTSADDRLVFTSGATEANNLAITGVCRASKHGRPHVVTVATEHRAVLDVVEGCAGDIRVTVLPVDTQGHVDPDLVATAIGSDTALVSVMHVNNEIGTIHDIGAIGRICRERDVLFHTDATQGFGRLPLDVAQMHIDLLSCSAHKIYGPKGCGALYVGARAGGHGVVAQFRGGGQEGGLRAGTLNVPGIVGLAAAAELAHARMQGDADHGRELVVQIRAALEEAAVRFTLYGPWPNRLPGNLHLRINGIRSDILFSHLRGIALSTGSACSAGAPGGSHVLRAIGLSAGEASQAFRIGVGRYTTRDEIAYFCDRFLATIHALRAFGHESGS